MLSFTAYSTVWKCALPAKNNTGNGALGPALSAGVFNTSPPFIYFKNLPEAARLLLKRHKANFCHGQNMSRSEITWSWRNRTNDPHHSRALFSVCGFHSNIMSLIIWGRVCFLWLILKAGKEWKGLPQGNILCVRDEINSAVEYEIRRVFWLITFLITFYSLSIF